VRLPICPGACPAWLPEDDALALHPQDAFGRQLLRPDATAPVALQPAGRQVCTCLNVAEPAIVGVLAGCGGSDGQRLQQLQQRLGCGTQCGSCVPTLQRLVAATPQPLASQAA
jgi:assimilatory nitrate reductase catalytic subunit